MKLFQHTKKSSQYFIEKINILIYNNYELVFNLSSIFSASCILRYSDLYMDCKRQDVHLTPLRAIFYHVNDFLSASYGYDSQCLKWKYFMQTLTLLWLVISLVCLMNQVEDYVHHYHISKYKNVYDSLRKLMVGLIVTNYCSKIYSTFLLTSCGHMIHNMIWTSFLHYNTNFPFLENFSKMKPLFDSMKLNLLYIPNLRSKFLLNKIPEIECQKKKILLSKNMIPS